MLDEVFGEDSFCADIVYVKTTGLGTKGLDDRFDYLLWYCRTPGKVKYRQLYIEKAVAPDGKGQSWFVQEESGATRGLQRSEKADLSVLPSGAQLYRPGD